MNLLEFLQDLTEDLNLIVASEYANERNSYCNESFETIQGYIKEEKDFEKKCKALTQCLLYFARIRPLFEDSGEYADKLGHFIFLECARLVLGIEFQQADEESQLKTAFKEAVKDSYNSLQTYGAGQVFVVLEWLILNGWNHPTLSLILSDGDVEHSTALSFLATAEFPELFKLRIEILIDQQCEDLALNLCSWCVRSPVFEHDVFVRKTHLLLLYKQEHDGFHDSCLNIPCCLLVKVLADLESDADSKSAALIICQTALLQEWLHPDPEKTCCTQHLLSCFLRLEKQKHEEKQDFLNSVNKILQLAVNNDQKRLLLTVMVDLFGDEYWQFCTEVALVTLKKDRFGMDTSKVKRDEAECDIATAALSNTCRAIAKLYRAHDQMSLASLMTVLYHDPDNETFMEIKGKLRSMECLPKREPVGPAAVDPDVYNEMYCVVDSLRPSDYHPTRGWDSLKQTLVMHMIENSFAYDRPSNTFKKKSKFVVDSSSSANTLPSNCITSLQTKSATDKTDCSDDKLKTELTFPKQEPKTGVGGLVKVEEEEGTSNCALKTDDLPQLNTPIENGGDTKICQIKNESISDLEKSKQVNGQAEERSQCLPVLSLDDLEEVLYEVNVTPKVEGQAVPPVPNMGQILKRLNETRDNGREETEKCQGEEEQVKLNSSQQEHSSSSIIKEESLPINITKAISLAGLHSTKCTHVRKSAFSLYQGHDDASASNLAVLQDTLNNLPDVQRNHLKKNISALLRDILVKKNVTNIDEVLRGTASERLYKILSSVKQEEPSKAEISRLQKLVVLDDMLLGIRNGRKKSSGSRSIEKRKRSAISSYAMEILKYWYSTHEQNPFPTAEDKKMLADKTGLTPKNISIWFQNHRQRMKKAGKIYTPKSGFKTPPRPSVEDDSEVNSEETQHENSDISEAGHCSNGDEGCNVENGIGPENSESEEQNLSEAQTEILKDWYNSHEKKPYPNLKARKKLCRLTGLDEKSVYVWFVHYRQKLREDKRLKKSRDRPLSRGRRLKSLSSPSNGKRSVKVTSESDTTAEHFTSLDSTLTIPSLQNVTIDSRPDCSVNEDNDVKNSPLQTSTPVRCAHIDSTFETSTLEDDTSVSLNSTVKQECSESVTDLKTDAPELPLAENQNYVPNDDLMMVIKPDVSVNTCDGTPRETRNTPRIAKNKVEQPVGSLDGFCLYLKEQRDEALKQHPVLEVRDTLTLKWNQLDESMKTSFAEQASKESSKQKVPSDKQASTSDVTDQYTDQSSLSDNASQDGKELKSQDTSGKAERARLDDVATQLLRNWFDENVDHPFLSLNERRILCALTGLPEKSIKIWFQNYRQKMKKQGMEWTPLRNENKSPARMAASPIRRQTSSTQHSDVDQRELSADDDSSGVTSRPGQSPRRRSSTPRAERNNPDYVRRPMNAFMMFYKQERDNLKAKNPDVDHMTLSKMVGNLWRELDEEGKTKYYSMAKEAREEHKRLYPDYVWNKRRNSPKPSTESPIAMDRNLTSTYRSQEISAPKSPRELEFGFHNWEQSTQDVEFLAELQMAQQFADDSELGMRLPIQPTSPQDSESKSSKTEEHGNQEEAKSPQYIELGPMVIHGDKSTNSPESQKLDAKLTKLIQNVVSPTSTAQCSSTENSLTNLDTTLINEQKPDLTAYQDSSFTLLPNSDVSSVDNHGYRSEPTLTTLSTPATVDNLVPPVAISAPEFVERQNSGMSDSSQSQSPDKRKKSGKGFHVFLTKEQTRILWSWMFGHLHYPYPTKDEINALAVFIKASPTQIYQWCRNTRDRKFDKLSRRVVGGKSENKSPLVISQAFLARQEVANIEELKVQLEVSPWEQLEPQFRQHLNMSAQQMAEYMDTLPYELAQKSKSPKKATPKKKTPNTEWHPVASEWHQQQHWEQMNYNTNSDLDSSHDFNDMQPAHAGINVEHQNSQPESTSSQTERERKSERRELLKHRDYVLWSWTLQNLHYPFLKASPATALALISGTAKKHVYKWMYRCRTSRLEEDPDAKPSEDGKKAYRVSQRTLGVFQVQNAEEMKQHVMPWRELESKMQQMFSLSETQQKRMLDALLPASSRESLESCSAPLIPYRVNKNQPDPYSSTAQSSNCYNQPPFEQTYQNTNQTMAMCHGSPAYGFGGNQGMGDTGNQFNQPAINPAQNNPGSTGDNFNQTIQNSAPNMAPFAHQINHCLPNVNTTQQHGMVHSNPDTNPSTHTMAQNVHQSLMAQNFNPNAIGNNPNMSQSMMGLLHNENTDSCLGSLIQGAYDVLDDPYHTNQVAVNPVSNMGYDNRTWNQAPDGSTGAKQEPSGVIQAPNQAVGNEVPNTNQVAVKCENINIPKPLFIIDGSEARNFNNSNRQVTNQSMLDSPGSQTSSPRSGPSSSPQSGGSPNSTLLVSSEKHVILWSWVLAHLNNPFPTKAEIAALSQLADCSRMQVRKWMYETRCERLEAVSDNKDTIFKMSHETCTRLNVKDLEGAKALFIPWSELEPKMNEVLKTVKVDDEKQFSEQESSDNDDVQSSGYSTDQTNTHQICKPSSEECNQDSIAANDLNKSKEPAVLDKEQCKIPATSSEDSVADTENLLNSKQTALSLSDFKELPNVIQDCKTPRSSGSKSDSESLSRASSRNDSDCRSSVPVSEKAAEDSQNSSGTSVDGAGDSLSTLNISENIESSKDTVDGVQTALCDVPDNDASNSNIGDTLTAIQGVQNNTDHSKDSEEVPQESVKDSQTAISTTENTENCHNIIDNSESKSSERSKVLVSFPDELEPNQTQKDQKSKQILKEADESAKVDTQTKSVEIQGQVIDGQSEKQNLDDVYNSVKQDQSTCELLQSANALTKHDEKAADMNHVSETSSVIKEKKKSNETPNKEKVVAEVKTEKGMEGIRKWKHFTKESLDILWSWMFNHLENPFPSKREMTALALITDSTRTQISGWMRRHRRTGLVVDGSTDNSDKNGKKTYTISQSQCKRMHVKDLAEARSKVTPYEKLEKQIEFYLNMDGALLKDSIEALEQNEGGPSPKSSKASKKSQQSSSNYSDRQNGGGNKKNCKEEEEYNDNLDDILSRMDLFEEKGEKQSSASPPSLMPLSEIDEIPAFDKTSPATPSGDEQKSTEEKPQEKEEESMFTEDGVRKTRCSFCRSLFITQAEKKAHQKTCVKRLLALQKQELATKEPENPLVCKFCNKEYESIAQRRRHEEFFCSEKANKIGDHVAEQEEDWNDFELEPEADDMETDQFFCDYCGREFSSQGKRDRHITRYHINMCDTDDDVDSENGSETGNLPQSKSKQKKNKTNSPQGAHTMRAKEGMLFQCPLCWRRFRSEKTLSKHTKDIHDVAGFPYLYTCPYLDCKRKSKPLTTLKGVESHVQRVHSAHFVPERVKYIMSPRFVEEKQRLDLIKAAKPKKSSKSKERNAEDERSTSDKESASGETSSKTSSAKSQRKSGEKNAAKKKGQLMPKVSCSYCEKKFILKTLLDRHVAEKHGDNRRRKTEALKRQTVHQKHKEIGKKYKKISDTQKKISAESSSVEEKYKNIRRSIRQQKQDSPLKKDASKDSLKPIEKISKKKNPPVAKPEPVVPKVMSVMKGPLDDDSDCETYMTPLIQTKLVKNLLNKNTVLLGPLSDSEGETNTPVTSSMAYNEFVQAGDSNVTKKKVETVINVAKEQLDMKGVMINPLDSDVELDDQSTPVSMNVSIDASSCSMPKLSPVTTIEMSKLHSSVGSKSGSDSSHALPVLSTHAPTECSVSSKEVDGVLSSGASSESQEVRPTKEKESDISVKRVSETVAQIVPEKDTNTSAEPRKDIVTQSEPSKPVTETGTALLPKPPQEFVSKAEKVSETPVSVSELSQKPETSDSVKIVLEKQTDSAPKPSVDNVAKTKETKECLQTSSTKDIPVVVDLRQTESVQTSAANQLAAVNIAHESVLTNPSDLNKSEIRNTIHSNVEIVQPSSNDFPDSATKTEQTEETKQPSQEDEVLAGKEAEATDPFEEEIQRTLLLSMVDVDFDLLQNATQRNTPENQRKVDSVSDNTNTQATEDRKRGETATEVIEINSIDSSSAEEDNVAGPEEQVENDGSENANGESKVSQSEKNETSVIEIDSTENSPNTSIVEKETSSSQHSNSNTTQGDRSETNNSVDMAKATTENSKTVGDVKSDDVNQALELSVTEVNNEKSISSSLNSSRAGSAMESASKCDDQMSDGAVVVLSGISSPASQHGYHTPVRDADTPDSVVVIKSSKTDRGRQNLPADKQPGKNVEDKLSDVEKAKSVDKRRGNANSKTGHEDSLQNENQQIVKTKDKDETSKTSKWVKSKVSGYASGSDSDSVPKRRSLPPRSARNKRKSYDLGHALDIDIPDPSTNEDEGDSDYNPSTETPGGSESKNATAKGNNKKSKQPSPQQLSPKYVVTTPLVQSAIRFKNDEFSCPMCLVIFKDENTFSAHMKLLHSISNLPYLYTCPKCIVNPGVKPMEFVSQEALKGHLQAGHHMNVGDFQINNIPIRFNPYFMEERKMLPKPVVYNMIVNPNSQSQNIVSQSPQKRNVSFIVTNTPPRPARKSSDGVIDLTADDDAGNNASAAKRRRVSLETPRQSQTRARKNTGPSFIPQNASGRRQEDVEDSPPLVCLLCDQHFRGQQKLNEHIKKEHPPGAEVANTKTPAKKRRQSKKVSSREERDGSPRGRAVDGYCPCCSNHFNILSSLYRHVKNMHPESFDTVKKLVNDQRAEMKNSPEGQSHSKRSKSPITSIRSSCGKSKAPNSGSKPTQKPSVERNEGRCVVRAPLMPYSSAHNRNSKEPQPIKRKRSVKDTSAKRQWRSQELRDVTMNDSETVILLDSESDCATDNETKTTSNGKTTSLNVRAKSTNVSEASSNVKVTSLNVTATSSYGKVTKVNATFEETEALHMVVDSD